MIKRRMIQGLLILALLCGAVLLAHPTAAWALTGTGTQEDPYRISSAAELQAFAKLVNDGDGDACAVLTDNITINEKVLDEDGSLNESAADTFTQWTPIGNGSKPYTGTFDGDNKTISGLYINSDAEYVGLFGYIGTNGTVKNLALADSSINSSGVSSYVGGICGVNEWGSISNCSNSGDVSGSSSYVGGICGDSGGSITGCSNSGTVSGSGIYVGGICGAGNGGWIEDCSNSGDVSGSGVVGGICGLNNGGCIEDCSNSGDVGSGSNVGGICGLNQGSITSCSNSGDVSGSNVGGICGVNDDGRIENCSNNGTVAGSGYVGGICGWNDDGSITSCSNSGTVTGGSTVGGICGMNEWGSISNCYWLATAYAGEGVGSGDGTVVAKTEDEYKSGEVAWLLNGESTNGPWRQNLGEGGDSVPTLDPTHGVVSSTGNGRYHNCERYDDNGFCTICRSYEPAVQDGTGNYQIENAGQLYWFAGLVNGGQTTANAVLTADIVLNTGLDQTKFAVNDDGTLTYNGSPDFSFDQWTPIGNDYDHRYTGTFDGKGHTISGLYINSNARYAGLFGCIGSGGTVKNLTLADSYISGGTYVGGICGRNYRGSIENCENSGSIGGVDSTAYVGGICGYNDKDTISDCDNSGNVTGSGSVGGICGENGGSITNCSNSGDVTGSYVVGGICGVNRGSITSGSITSCSNSGPVTGSYIVGGICGCNDEGTITNCSNSGPVTGSGAVTVAGSGYSYVGGICGLNRGSITSGTITNCSNSGTVTVHNSSSSSTAYVGGICGWNDGSIENCDNSGTVTYGGVSIFVYVGGICGDNDGGTITNCYWLDSTAGAGIGNDSGGATQKSEDEYKSGGVAWLLNQWSGDGVLNGKVWAMGENGYPVLNGKSDNIVVKLTFDTNTGKEEEQPIIRYGNVGEALPNVTLPEITGCTFDGWYNDADCSGEQVTKIPDDATGDKTYYAKWTANVYTVTLNTNNGTINSGDVTSYTYGIGATLPTDVTRSGYTFGGWYDNEALSGDPVTAISAEATGDQTYWAKWTAKQTPPPTIPPTVSEKTIDAIADAELGETVTVDLSSGSTKLDKEVFETLAGKDVTLVVDLGDGVSWTVNGSDIPADADFTDIDMGVTMNSDGIPVDIINAITGEHGSVQVTLAHNGAFGFTMTLTAPLGEENAGLWANLYHFKVNDGEAGREGPLGDDEEAGEMTFETAAEIGDDGSVALAFSHASQYAIVIDDHNHGVIDLPFTDVSDSDWFYDPVVYVYENGLMTGTSATTFEPNIATTRGMLVSILHRLEGGPSAESAGFSDVSDGDWYAQAVNWAASVGVVNGFDDGTFQPNAAITREQLAAILMNYAQYKGQDVSARATLDTYNDATAISSWANDVMSWAVAEGLLTGVTNDQLQPQGNATRAQVAAILQRFLSE